MKALLMAVNARYSHSNPAIYLLKKVLADNGPEVVTAEWSINNQREQILERIYGEKPDLIGISAYIWNINYLEILAADIKKLLPKAILIFGGPQAGGEKKKLLQRIPAVDGLVIGEGEETLPKLVKAMGDGQIRPKLPGVLWQGDETFEEAPRIDLSHIPFLYSRDELAALTGKLLYYESSRGCPFGCTFCFSAHDKLRERPLEMVKEDLTYLAGNFQGQFKLVDRTFNANIGRAEKISEYLLELYRPGISWHLEISPYNLPDRLLTVWRQAPDDYLRLEAGVQSLNPAVLRNIGRKGDWQEAKSSIMAIMERDNLRLHLDLIAGLPGETWESFEYGFNEVHQLMPHYLQLGFLKILPGSLLEAEASKRGIVYSPYPPYRVIATPELPPQQLFILQRVEEMVDGFYNTGRFRQTLGLAAEYWPGGAMAFYLALAKARVKPADSPMSLKEKAELLWGLLSQLPQSRLFFDTLRLDWFLYGKGEPLPAIFRGGEEKNNSQGKGILLTLSHRIDFCGGGKLAFGDGTGTYLIDQTQRSGVTKRSFCQEI